MTALPTVGLPRLFLPDAALQDMLYGQPLRRIGLTETLARSFAEQISEKLYDTTETGLTAEVLEQDGLFSSIHYRSTRNWSELLVRYFPYVEGNGSQQWFDLSGEVLAFEELRWRASTALRGAPPDEGGPDPSLAWQERLLSPWESTALPRILTLTIRPGLFVPALVRRFIPWPNVGIAGISDAQLRPMLEKFYEEDLVGIVPEAQALPLEEAWTLLTRPADATGGRRSPLTRSNLLTNGQQLLPTRWRSFFRDGATLRLNALLKRPGPAR